VSPRNRRGTGRARLRRAGIVTVGLWLALATVSRPAGASCETAGTTAAGFLCVGTGAGVLGRGGATLGLGGELDMVPWNAAALGWLDETQIALAHATLVDDTQQEWAAVGGRAGRTGLRWSVEGLYQSEGRFEGRDALDQDTGEFDVASMALGLHVAHPLGPLVTVGVGGKYVGEKLGPVSGAGYTLDAGLQARAGIVGAGVAVTNLGGSMSYSGSSYDLPMNVGVGAAADLPGTGLRLAVDANFPRSYYRDVRVGAEWRFHGILALRAGYRRELEAPRDLAEDGPSFGVGAGLRGLWLDYAYVIPGVGDGQHRIAISLRPGRLTHLVPSPLGVKGMPKSFDEVDAAGNTVPREKPAQPE
jgi:hypothetical protein